MSPSSTHETSLSLVQHQTSSSGISEPNRSNPSTSQNQLHLRSADDALVETAPEVYAGADMALKVRVACSSGCDLRGKMIKLITQGAAIKEIGVELTELDGEATATEEFIVKAPNKPGEYTWDVLFPAFENDGVTHAASSATLTFTAIAHQIFMSIWDTPSPATTGEKFSVKIGAKCSAGCVLAEIPFTVEDSSKQQVATGKLWKEELPQTRGLYWAEQELIAPPEEGLYEWNARLVTSDLKIPHEATPKEFPFFAARPPDCVATITVVDKTEQVPLRNASIFIDRRRANTDENGTARLGVTKGKHELYVSKHHYEVFQTTVEVDGDVSVKAELMFDPDILINGNDRFS